MADKEKGEVMKCGRKNTLHVDPPMAARCRGDARWGGGGFPLRYDEL